MKTINEETDEAIEQSYRNANRVWREKTIDNLFNFCKNTKTFTMNDFREYNRHIDPLIKTHDNRAMGGIIKTARSRGWIEPTGNVIISRVGHKSPLQVWRSLIVNNEVTEI